jgi:hypothetical protein
MSALYARFLSVSFCWLTTADREAEEVVEPTHPLGVATREVVVHRDDVDALAFEGVQVTGEGGDEGLALARAHLGDGALVQDHAPHELHVEVPHFEHAARGLSAHGEGGDEDVVEAGARCRASP